MSRGCIVLLMRCRFWFGMDGRMCEEGLLFDLRSGRGDDYLGIGIGIS